MTEQEIETWKKRIDEMTHEDMCRFYRFARIGHPVFDRTLPLGEYFRAKFRKLGGFTPEISKKIGWEKSQFEVHNS